MSRGIPTMYAGIRFRSRLEATWAAFFDLLGWRWEYEPFDMAGYIPDFSISTAAGLVVIDVKPIDAWAAAVDRGLELGYLIGEDHIAIVIGVAPMEWPGGNGCPLPALGHLAIDAGVVYAEPADVVITKCLLCSRIVFAVDYSCSACGRDWAYKDETGTWRCGEGGVDEGLIDSLWATAKNRAQWKGAFGG